MPRPVSEIIEQSLIITEEDLLFKRLDLLLAHHFPQYSRSLLKNYFQQGHITCSDQDLELKRLPPLGSEIILKIPPAQDYDIVAENIPLDILFEDEYLLFVNKPAGMVVHPAAGNWQSTLVHALCYHCPDLKGIGNIKRPGIVHRLDKGTSGVMVVAKEQKCHQELIKIFSTHQLIRRYHALIFNQNDFSLNGKIETLFERSQHNRLKMTSRCSHGKVAKTFYQTLKQGEKLSLLELTLHTGRTHQIRVHLSERLNRAILNDELYGNVKQQHQMLTPQQRDILADYPHPLLHAQYLSLTHPMTQQKLEFSVPPPSPLQQLIETL